MYISRRIKSKSASRFTSQMFWTSRSVEKLGDVLAKSQAESEARLAKAQIALEKKLVKAQTAAVLMSKEDNKSSEERLTKAQAAADLRFSESQAKFREDMFKFISFNNWKLTGYIVSAVIFILGSFEALGGVIIYPWRRVDKPPSPN